MARPEKNTVDYFPHPSRHGKKMAYIRKKYGNDGYATWFIILEQLGDSERHHLDLSNEIGVMYLETACDVDQDTLFSIINDLVKLGEFDHELWNDYRILFSQKFINSIQDAYLKRSNKPASRNEILQHLRVSTPLNIQYSTGNTVTSEFPLLKGDENTQRKGKEIKGKEIKEEERGFQGENPPGFSAAENEDAFFEQVRTFIADDTPEPKKETENNLPATNQTGGEPEKPKRLTQLDMLEFVVLPHDTEEFRQAWVEWLKYKTIIRDPYKAPATMQAALKKFADHPPETGIKAIHDSISNQWKGVFPEKSKYNERNHQNNPQPASTAGSISRTMQRLAASRGAG